MAPPNHDADPPMSPEEEEALRLEDIVFLREMRALAPRAPASSVADGERSASSGELASAGQGATSEERAEFEDAKFEDAMTRLFANNEPPLAPEASLPPEAASEPLSVPAEAPRGSTGPPPTAPPIFVPDQSRPPRTPPPGKQRPKNPLLHGSARALERRLRQGEIEPSDQIDLHRMTRGDAINALDAFLERSVHHGHELVLVIMGKGMHSVDLGVLKEMVPVLLARRWPDWVRQTVQVPPRLGGSGAIAVFLRRMEP